MTTTTPMTTHHDDDSDDDVVHGDDNYTDDKTSMPIIAQRRARKSYRWPSPGVRYRFCSTGSPDVSTLRPLSSHPLAAVDHSIVLQPALWWPGDREVSGQWRETITLPTTVAVFLARAELPRLLIPGRSSKLERLSRAITIHSIREHPKEKWSTLEVWIEKWKLILSPLTGSEFARPRDVNGSAPSRHRRVGFLWQMTANWFSLLFFKGCLR